MEDEPSTLARAKKLVRRIEEETASAYAKLGEKMLENHNSIPHLKKSLIWYLGQHFDIHAKWYLSVIETYEQVDTTYTNLLLEVAEDTAKGKEKLRSQWPNLQYVTDDADGVVILLRSRVHHWKSVALKKVREAEEAMATIASASIPTRRGYRQEIRAWMEKKDIASVKEAATRLAVSVSTLNSIMADHGKVKYSEETLANVLRKIAPKKS